MFLGEFEQVAQYAASQLTLHDAALGDEYYYGSLTLCVIDAVYSIGVRYEGVRAVVQRYCAYFSVQRVRCDRNAVPLVEAQEPLSALCARCDQFGAERMSSEVFCNRQRTSTRNGILKAEAVGRFATVLRAHRIERFQDIGALLPSPALEQAIANIPGQRSGISLSYFWMLAGSDDLIKPDRMILRFLQRALGRVVYAVEAQSILAGATRLLAGTHPGLTPRLLDYKIWEYERRAGERTDTAARCMEK